MVNPLERSIVGPDAAEPAPGRPERTFCKSDNRIFAASLGFVAVAEAGVPLLLALVVVVVDVVVAVAVVVVVDDDDDDPVLVLDLCLDPPALGELVRAANPLPPPPPPPPKSCINWD